MCFIAGYNLYLCVEMLPFAFLIPWLILNCSNLFLICFFKSMCGLLLCMYFDMQSTPQILFMVCLLFWFFTSQLWDQVNSEAAYYEVSEALSTKMLKRFLNIYREIMCPIDDLGVVDFYLLKLWCPWQPNFLWFSDVMSYIFIVIYPKEFYFFCVVSTNNAFKYHISH